MDSNEAIEIIREVQKALYDQTQTLKWVASEIRDSHDDTARTLRNYIIPPLEILRDKEHDWLDGSENLEDIVNLLSDQVPQYED